MAKDNRTLGRFQLSEIPSAPRGIPQIEVAFDIDANGIVNVSALDKATNKKQTITITSSSGLNEDEIKKMVDDAKIHAEEDKKNRELIETRNQADNLIFSTEKLMNDHKDKLPEADRKNLETVIADAKKALESNDIETIKQKVDALTQASHKLAEAMYKQAGAEQQTPPPPPPPNTSDTTQPKDNVVDAEFEEKQ